MADQRPDLTDQFRGQFRLGPKDDVFGDAGFLSAAAVVGPVLGRYKRVSSNVCPPGPA